MPRMSCASQPRPRKSLPGKTRTETARQPAPTKRNEFGNIKATAAPFQQVRRIGATLNPPSKLFHPSVRSDSQREPKKKWYLTSTINSLAPFHPDCSCSPSPSPWLFVFFCRFVLEKECRESGHRGQAIGPACVLFFCCFCFAWRELVGEGEGKRKGKLKNKKKK